jgi:membrane protease YdiL (CAAX protease family)
MDEPQASHEPEPAVPDDEALVTPPDSQVSGAVELPPEKVPFWGYSDVLVFAGMAIPSMLFGWAIVQGLIRLLHLRVTFQAAELIPEQFLGYAFLFGALALLLRIQYGKPFWESLGWKPSTIPPNTVMLAGVTAAISVALLSAVLRTPNTPNPMTDLMRERSAMILLGIFGTTVGPLCEELAFRGFLQPLLIRSFGVVPGIILAAAPFGLLHFQEYGYSWRHAVLISFAGAAFGWMRHSSGSTRAATLMHASYNALFFAATFGRTVPQP